MTPRWPDGSIFVEDPHAAAARLEAETFGWRVWFGDATRSFWATPRGRRGRLIEAKTIDGLAEQMIQTTATHSPASSPPRGQGAPRFRADDRRALRGD
jgi:hypothetical protein